MAHESVALLKSARAAGVTLRLVNGELDIAACSEPDAALVVDLRRYRTDITILAKAAAELHVGIGWCAAQLGPDDHPAELGYPCIKHCLALCLERRRDQERSGRLPAELDYRDNQ